MTYITEVSTHLAQQPLVSGLVCAAGHWLEQMLRWFCPNRTGRGRVQSVVLYTGGGQVQCFVFLCAHWLHRGHLGCQATEWSQRLVDGQCYYVCRQHSKGFTYAGTYSNVSNYVERSFPVCA